MTQISRACFDTILKQEDIPSVLSPELQALLRKQFAVVHCFFFSTSWCPAAADLICAITFVIAKFWQELRSSFLLLEPANRTACSVLSAAPMITSASLSVRASCWRA